MRLLADAHLDLAMNLVYYDRDLRLPVDEINRQEKQLSLSDTPFRGNATLSLPELKTSGLGICVATLLARSGPDHGRKQKYDRIDLDFGTPDGAYCAAHTQLAWYHLMQERGEIRLLKSREDIDQHWQLWTAASSDQYESLPLGVILSMEGADPISSPDQTSYWYNLGLRAIGPAHYGASQYAQGTGADGPLTDWGFQLLAEMQKLGMVLDVTHLADTAMQQALDVYEGPVWASRHNCRSLVNWDRQLTDEQIQKLVKRNAVIGIACDAIMLHPGWDWGVTQPDVLSITSLVDQIDHICQQAGNTSHVAIGTDLDGGYGNEQTPRELKRYRDLHLIDEILQSRGYEDSAIDAIFHGNWLRKFREYLPAESIT